VGQASFFGVKRAWITCGAAAVLVAAGGAARAGVFDGFGGREDAYLVGADRVCAPLAVAHGAAHGAPACHQAASDEIARLSVKAARPERGAQAKLAARAAGRTLTVTRVDGGQTLVRWDSLDPISRVVDVYASSYGNLVAVEMMVRRGGRDRAEVVGFDLRGAAPAHPAAGSEAGSGAGSGAGAASGSGAGSGSSAGAAATPDSPALRKALARARKTRGAGAQLRAWKQVLAVDADSSEARFGLAVAHARMRHQAEALADLAGLTRSSRADAIEYLVAARFDRAFARLRADPAFRKAVGLDRPAATFYERLMGMGGAWEQEGTSCDTPQVDLTLSRDRTVAIRVKSACEGMRFDDRFHGTWAAQDPVLVLRLPNPDGGSDEVPCKVERKDREAAIHCVLSGDLDFVVQPVRR
jgi:hypothetical protein